MELARDKRTGAMVEGEDLWMLPHVDRDGYECGGCGIQVFPASYEQSNLQRPHFRKPKNVSHEEGCDIDGHEKTISRGAKGSVLKELETSPDLSPSRLTLREERPKIDPELSPTSEQTSSTRVTERADDDGKVRAKGRRAANSIRPICKAFIRFPFDRLMSLDVPGVDEKTYLKAFKKLGGNGITVLANTRIFYAELAWAKPQEEDDCLIIPLSAGEWSKDKKLTRPYRVRIDWSQWSAYKKTMVRNELEVVRKEGIAAKKKDPKHCAYLFFVAAQDAHNPELFNVTDHRLVCGLLGKMTYPDL
jgi:hypothetical protein